MEDDGAADAGGLGVGGVDGGDLGEDLAGHDAAGDADAAGLLCSRLHGSSGSGCGGGQALLGFREALLEVGLAEGGLRLLDRFAGWRCGCCCWNAGLASRSLRSSSIFLLRGCFVCGSERFCGLEGTGGGFANLLL